LLGIYNTAIFKPSLAKRGLARKIAVVWSVRAIIVATEVL